MRKLTLVTFVVFALAVLSFASDVPKGEIFGGYSYMSIDTNPSGLDRFGSNGWAGSATYNFNRFFGIQGEISGQYASDIFNPGDSIHQYNFLAGPQLGYRAGKVRPFVHALIGGSRLNVETPGSPDFTDTVFAVEFGGGLDVKVSKHVAVRLGQVDLLHTTFFDDSQNHISYKAGIVFNLGGN